MEEQAGMKPAGNFIWNPPPVQTEKCNVPGWQQCLHSQEPPKVSVHLFSVLADKHQVILVSAQQLRMSPMHNIIRARRSCCWIIKFAIGGIQLFLQHLCKSKAKGLQLGPSLHFTGRQFFFSKGACSFSWWYTDRGKTEATRRDFIMVAQKSRQQADTNS